MKEEKNEPIDLDFFRTVTGGDQGFEKELLKIFIDGAKSNLAKIEKALAESDETAWAMACHALKGSSKSIGAFELGSAVEICHRSNPVKEERTRYLEEAKNCLARVEEFISKVLNYNI